MPKRKCTFTEELKKKFLCFRQGRDPYEAECLTCKAGTYVSVANKGANDLQVHVNSKKHAKAARGESSKAEVTDFFVTQSDSVAVTAAEGSFAFHTVKHHESYRSMDCTSGLLRKAFTDSPTAQKFSCARTKTEAIINSVIAQHSVDVALEALQGISYCGVSTDGSNHGAVKLFPLLIQYYDWKNGGVQSKLIEIKSPPNESADTIAQYIKDTLQKKGIFSKCIAFTGDHCNTMFGGIRHNEEGKNVFANLKKSLQNTALIGVGLPAHNLNNCVHHGADTLDLDIEQIIFKIYHHFNIYTVRTENLKKYCEFADVNYRALLSHSKTRWLSLFPGIERLLQMYPALKAFFLSQDRPPVQIKTFFEDEFSEIYLWQMHSLMSVFQSNIQEMEREDNSVVEVKRILNKVQSLLHERKMNNFMPLKVKSMLAQKQKDGNGQRCDHFSAQVQGLYSSCLDYLQKWMAPMEEFSTFMWMDLSEIPDWNDVEACIKNLAEKGVEVDDAKCFDEVTNLKTFIEKNCAEFSDLQAHQRWTKFFERSKSVDFHSELLKMVQFFFAIPAHNANVERIFSLMQAQWTKERNRMSVDSLKGILCTQYNFRNMTCKDFHSYLMGNLKLLKEMQSSDKYTRQEED
uniref:DUF4371 domain-containing protein n=1 Tax=Astyanax mexicanus TaxID=7994 RepID=A0A8B9KYY9_ASTMX